METRLVSKPFSKLSEDELGALFAFLTEFGPPPPFPDPGAMRQDLSTSVFNGGQNFLTIWMGETTVVGTIGIVTKEARAKGEIFLTSIYLKPQHKGVVRRLIDEAYQVALAAEGVRPGITVRLGVRENLSYLKPEVEKTGFKEHTHLLELRRDAAGMNIPDIPVSKPGPAAGSEAAADLESELKLKFMPLSEHNLADFVAVHNAAFLDSANAGLISLEEAREMLEKAPAEDLQQVGYVGSVPAVIFDLRLQDSAGWIDGLGVHPAYQGRELGKTALQRAITVLREHGATEVRLMVVEANTRALSLYRHAGFTLDRVFSTSYAGALPSK
ncbi:MAG: GNAT family N-acetyltransferase [Firmicutes bacterium]|nr:GNAT family N-acetyltransferase [Bacillota bacterium]